MKKLFLTGIGFFLAMGLTFAQQVDIKNPEEKATSVVNVLTEQLALTDEQKATTFTISLEHAKQSFAAIADTSIADDALLGQLNQLQQAADAKIDAILSDEQKEVFKKVVAERPAAELPVRPAKAVEETTTDESGN
ncbi:hypothetical protein J5U18_11595 [Sphingobacteriaceae bacterium WQ 2009]|uniref:LTXXQ motif family protein n=1 Tax=Rhinopithecimicrobium faecis TaxID=2820698 RepID=A0A8T4HFS3_9SPHI|nr:hypothetical protein [Sphingobacteriaceae bacterium WQ 2009]